MWKFWPHIGMPFLNSHFIPTYQFKVTTSRLLIIENISGLLYILTNISGLLLTTCDIFVLTHILHIVEHLLAWHNLDMLPLSHAYLLASHCFIKANWMTILQSIQKNNHSTTDVSCTLDLLYKIFRTCHETDICFISDLLNSWEFVCYKYKPA